MIGKPNTISIIGMGQSFTDLTRTHLDIINASDILVGGKRHLNEFSFFKGEKKEITNDFNELADFLQSHITEKKISVLASGDPLFYGVGSFLLKRLGTDHVTVYPNVTSVGAAFSKIKMPWQDAHVISFHGRSMTDNVMKAVADREKIAIYTSPANSPGAIAAQLLQNGVTGFRMCVLEKIGCPDERISWIELKDAVGCHFQDPNMIILIKDEDKLRSETPYRLISGTDADQFVHENGLITKAEVRVIAISKLDLASHHVMWDLGAGCGSVSLEASLSIHTGRIIAVEKNVDRIHQIRENINRFRVKSVAVVHETLPDGLDRLPEPDRIFIGGGGKSLKSIINESVRRLKEKGIIVINTVLLENLETARQSLAENRCAVEVVQIHISRSHDMPYGHMLKSENPVWIITGKKNTGDS